MMKAIHAILMLWKTWCHKKIFEAIICSLINRTGFTIQHTCKIIWSERWLRFPIPKMPHLVYMYTLNLLFCPKDLFWTHTQVIYLHPIGSYTMDLTWHTNGIRKWDITSVAAYLQLTAKYLKEIFHNSHQLVYTCTDLWKQPFDPSSDKSSVRIIFLL